MRISFARTDPTFTRVLINGKAIDIVPTVKLLGLNISNGLRWNCHVAEISRKVSTRLYSLSHLKRANVVTICIHPITENACAIFHHGLPLYLSDELECLQKRTLRIIFPSLSYRDAMSAANLSSLADRRSTISAKLFADI